MIVHDSSPESVTRMTPVDLATANGEPLGRIRYFDFHGCTCGIASFAGRPPWELHTAADELRHILPGAVKLSVLQSAARVCSHGADARSPRPQAPRGGADVATPAVAGAFVGVDGRVSRTRSMAAWAAPGSHVDGSDR